MNKKKIIIIGVVVAVLLAAAGLTVFLVNKHTMIKVVGMDKKDAIEKLESDTFINYKIVKEDKGEAFNHEKGYVYKQSVPSGSISGSVKLYCAQGFRYMVPEIQGKNYSKLSKEEKEALAKFDTVNVYEEYADSGKGKILSAGNEDYYGRVPKEAPINIYVCKARVPHVDMLEGDNWYKVKKYFKGADIKVRKELGKKKGEITSFVQTPCKMGGKVKIEVTISDGKGVYVPDITGMREKKAINKLRKKGIKYKIKYVYPNMYSDSYKPKNKVKEQSDEGIIKKSKKVTLIVKKPAIRIKSIRLDINSAGGVDTNMVFNNLSNKVINYIKFNMRYYNRVGDPIDDEIQGGNSINLNYTGPLAPHSSTEQEKDSAMYDESTACVAPYSAVITFKNGKKQKLQFMKKYHRYWWWKTNDFAADDINDPEVSD